MDVSTVSTPSPEPDSRRSWGVALAGAIAMVFTFGTPLSYGIFQQPFSETFAVSPVALSGVFAVMLFTFFIGSGLVGIFAARLPVRGVLLVCTIVTALLAPSLYAVDSYLGLTFVFAALGLALGTVFVLVASVVPRWFDERRGAATGLIFVGNGLGLFVLPPIWQYALSTVGVREGFLIIIATTASAFFLASLLCRRPPWATRSTDSNSALVSWLSGLIRARTFQLLFVGMSLAFAWYQLLAAYAIDLFAARGLTEAGASTLFGLIGGVSIISRIGGGYIADIVGSRRAFLASLGCAAVGIVLLLVPQYAILTVAVFSIGLGLGGCATLYIPLLMETYNPEKDTAIIGVFNVGGGIGALAMPPLGTASVAYTESYTVAILLTLGVTIVSFWAVVVGTAGGASTQS
ncbi:major facilitator superfamily transport protein (plasmid) [Natrialba magadii ATCC 43099]|uniref:Major facilitator superfamily protein n=1 Tax=Natrialba magadii (strain ATCC 43099 / DSM 3394 / CCM 3739 / CIP 104546 / IAM 13178 / JCM 8861 / NBRC 102185 / NCIMB 2190 / MS3) TaxID=547559 RepID=D3T1H3_NATMM|nr:MFS transporter [Natrialba magadii]ADD07432.1 major facilitator superfamily transport protein [Natrialba magadii ATCC 43099]ELY32240.1 major facilitator superfamily protein [Natrialba magadii ATCC 43099]